MGRAALAAAALVGAAAVAGCGGHGAARKQVDAYVRQAAALEQQLQAPLTQVTNANRSFAKAHPNLPQIDRRLRTARAHIRRVEARLGALQPPPQAAHLRVLLLRLVGQEDELTGEVDRLAVFTPAFAETLAPVGAATVQLKRALAGKTPGKAKAGALRSFAVVAAVTRARLARLAPPPVSRPSLTSELAALQRVQASSLALATALATGQAKRIPELLHAFDAAAVATQTVAAQRADIAAVKAYDARIRRLGVLAAAIAREEARVARLTS